jgi:hypothetical protein
VGQVPVFISPRNRVAQLNSPGTGSHNSNYINTDGRLREITAKYAVTNCDEAFTEWNYGKNEGEDLCHKSIQHPKPLRPMYTIEWRMNEKQIKCLPLVPSAESKLNMQDTV